MTVPYKHRSAQSRKTAVLVIVLFLITVKTKKGVIVVIMMIISKKSIRYNHSQKQAGS